MLYGGNTWITNKDGILNKAIKINTRSNIKLPTIIINGLANYSISMWIKTDDVTNDKGCLFSFNITPKKNMYSHIFSKTK